MVVRYCICGNEICITGLRAGEASDHLAEWGEQHWGWVGRDLVCQPGHGPCTAVECWQARTMQPAVSTGVSDGL